MFLCLRCECLRGGGEVNIEAAKGEAAHGGGGRLSEIRARHSGTHGDREALLSRRTQRSTE